MITHKKNIINFQKKFDFNELANFKDQNNLESEFSTIFVHPKFVLESPIKISNVNNDFYFNNIFEFLNKEYNPKKLKSNLFLFFSFSGGGKSMPHKDKEDVVIIGLYGKVMYVVENKNFELEEGDLIVIPAGVTHRAIGLCPRITLSFGVYG